MLSRLPVPLKPLLILLGLLMLPAIALRSPWVQQRGGAIAANPTPTTTALGPIHLPDTHADSELASYIGRRYTAGDMSAFPGNLSDIGGWMVYDRTANEPLEWAIAEITTPERDALILFFNREVGRSGDHAVWEVRDALALPMERADGRLLETHYPYSNCAMVDNAQNLSREAMKWDPEIIAVMASSPDSEFLSGAEAAWQANRTTGQFEALPPENIVCENPSWGI